MGFDTGDSVTPIIPVMCGESSTIKAMTQALGEIGVMAAIVFPMVARDKARHPNANVRRIVSSRTLMMS